MKTCLKCKQIKKELGFPFAKNRKDGLYQYCRKCHRLEAKKYHNKHREESRDYQRNYRKQNPELTLLLAAKHRSKRKGWFFNLELNDIQIPNRCPVLGIPIFIQVGKGKYPNAPSLDRIDNTKGYVKGNVAIVSWRANDIRGNATTEELEKVISFYKKHEQ